MSENVGCVTFTYRQIIWEFARLPTIWQVFFQIFCENANGYTLSKSVLILIITHCTVVLILTKPNFILFHTVWKCCMRNVCVSSNNLRVWPTIRLTSSLTPLTVDQFVYDAADAGCDASKLVIFCFFPSNKDFCLSFEATWRDIFKVLSLFWTRLLGSDWFTELLFVFLGINYWVKWRFLSKFEIFWSSRRKHVSKNLRHCFC